MERGMLCIKRNTALWHFDPAESRKKISRLPFYWRVFPANTRRRFRQSPSRITIDYRPLEWLTAKKSCGFGSVLTETTISCSIGFKSLINRCRRRWTALA